VTLSDIPRMNRGTAESLAPVWFAVKPRAFIFWMWFDDIDSSSAWNTFGGFFVAIGALPVAFWTWWVWLPGESF
jgi:hypothetical protein